MPDMSILWFAMSQAFGVLALITVFITFQMKDKERLLFWSIILTILMTAMFLSLQEWTIAMVVGTATLRNIVFYWVKKNQDRVRIWHSVTIMLVFAFVPVIMGSFTATEWYDFAILIMTPIFVWGLWQNNTHIFRFIAMVNACFFLFANIWVLNYLGIAIEVSFMVSIIVFYSRYFARRAKVLDTL